MTSKQKALALVNSYTHKLPAPSDCEKINYPLYHQGRLIASMVANEVKKEIEKSLDLVATTYWENVIKEIERL